MKRGRCIIPVSMALGLLTCACGVGAGGLGERDPLLDDCATVGFGSGGLTGVQAAGVDILVVVDNTISMAEEQANLAANFPNLLEALLNPPDVDGDTLPDHEPVRDLHIGVVSTDMGTGGYSVETCSDPIDGDNGELQHRPNPSMTGCDAVYPVYLSYTSEGPDIDMISWIQTGFGCIATLGINGCGWEQQLKAATRALSPGHTSSGGPNAGFLRLDSYFLLLFLTDDEDCSIAPGNESIFDSMESSLGHMGLRCYHHPYMLEPLENYVTAFQSLRTNPGKLLLGFIVGVPPGAECEGGGDEIPSCLEHPDMVEQIDPVSMTRLLPACVSSTGQADPARRFVLLARQFGDGALVQSICADDYRPAIENLTAKLHEKLEGLAIVREVQTYLDPGDTCRCMGTCEVIESLSDSRSCDTEGKPCWEPDGPGTGCAAPEVDVDGILHTLCEIPQAGTRMSPCERGVTGCDDIGITHTIDGEGWYYMGSGWREAPGDVHYYEPQIKFTMGMEPAMGSNVYLSCQDCWGTSSGGGSGGRVGSSCVPSVCPELLGDCHWDHSSVYFAEAGQCGGGACMVFRASDAMDAYCTRRCGPGAEIGDCPSGFECFAPVLVGASPGCWCVDRFQIDPSEGHPDEERLAACR